METIPVLEKKLREILNKEFKTDNLIVDNRSITICFKPSDLAKEFIRDYSKHNLHVVTRKENFMLWNSSTKNGFIPKTFISTEIRVTGLDSIKIVVNKTVRQPNKLMCLLLTDLIAFISNVFIPAFNLFNSKYIPIKDMKHTNLLLIYKMCIEFKYVTGDELRALLSEFITTVNINVFSIDSSMLDNEDIEEIKQIFFGNIQNRDNELRGLSKLKQLLINKHKDEK